MHDAVPARSLADSPAQTGPAGLRNGTRTATRVLIVGDDRLDPCAASGLRCWEPDIEVCGVAGSVEEALGTIGELRPDVAVVYADLETSSQPRGFAALTTLSRRIPVLIVVERVDPDWLTDTLDAGVHGFLLRAASTKELADAAQAVADGVLALDRSAWQGLAGAWLTWPRGWGRFAES